jgi:hypothetical protein
VLLYFDLSSRTETPRFAFTRGFAIPALRNWPGQVQAPGSRPYSVLELYLDNLIEFLPRGTLFPNFDHTPPALHPVCVEMCTVIISKLDDLEKEENKKLVLPLSEYRFNKLV